MVSPQSFVIADVGCDHAYVSIALVQRNLAKHVIAMDVKKGPLEIAKRNIKEQRLEEWIELRLGDGLNKLMPDEADTIIIAGMGGILMTSILKEGKEVLESGIKKPCLILQPQSDFDLVRIFLQQHAYHIVQEKMLVDGKKYYTVIKALPGKEENAYTPVELLYGKWNLENRDPVLFSYLEKERNTLCQIEGQLKKTEGNPSDKRIKDRMRELKNQQKLNYLAGEYFQKG